jgi:hypothetical protein
MTEAVSRWKKELSLVWLGLMGLTLLGPKLGASGLLLGLVGLKFLAICWSFMEMRSAHPFWKFFPPACGALVLLVARLTLA